MLGCVTSIFHFRSVDNFVNGYGLTWNISREYRLYILYVAPISFFYFFTREPFYTVIFISILFLAFLNTHCEKFWS